MAIKTHFKATEVHHFVLCSLDLQQKIR